MQGELSASTADVNSIRAFVRQVREDGGIDELAADATFDVLSRFEQYVTREKVTAPERIAALLEEPAIEVFHLDEEMLLRSTHLAAETALELQSFDAAILAAVLVRGEALQREGNEVSFCTHDTHL